MATVLSCIMPVYNAGVYLDAAVQSVLSQSFGWFELLLVDDGSTDGSGRLCDELSRGDARVRVLHQPNGGAAAARNTGLSHAEGRYLCFVDADDRLAPGAFERIVKAMENHEADLVSFGLDFCTETGRTSASYPAFFAAGLTQFWPHFIGYYRAGLFFSLCNKAYRTELIRKAGLSFEPGRRTGEDVLFNFAYFEQVRRFEHLDAQLYEYWHHPASLTRSATLDNMETSQAVLRQVKGFLQRHGQGALYPPLAAAQLPWDAASFYSLLTDSSKPYTLAQRTEGLQKLFGNEMWHAALLSALAGRAGAYQGWLRFAAARKSPLLATLPLRLKKSRSQ